MTDNLSIFRREYLAANTWAQRKDGVPLELLDALSFEELEVAESELIQALSLRDDWPIIGVGHIKSKNALPTLLKLLDDSKGGMRVKIAHAIFQISGNNKMKDIVLETMPTITGEFELINVLYYLPFFKDETINKLLHTYRSHKKYLVAYNATERLGLPTEQVIEKFRNQSKPKSFWNKLFR